MTEGAFASTLTGPYQSLAKGYYREARDGFISAAKRSKRSAGPLVGLARVYRARGKEKRELEFIERARKLAPDSPDVLIAWGEYLLLRGRATEAHSAFHKATRSGRRPWSAWTNLGRARLRLGDTEGARMAFEYVVDDYNRAPRQTYESLLAAAEAASHTNDKRGALRLLSRAANMPNVVPIEAFIASGHLFYSTYQVGDAIEDFKRALKLNPRSADALAGLAQCHVHDRRYRLAATLARKAITTNEFCLPSYLLQARMKLIENDPAGAQEFIDKVAKVDANHPKLLAIRACERFIANDLNGMEQVLQKRHSVAPNDGSLLLEVGGLATMQRRNKEAERFLRRGLKRDPRSAQLYKGLGELLLRDGRGTEARQMLERAHRIDKHMVTVVNYLKVLEYMAQEYVVSLPKKDVLVHTELRDSFWQPKLLTEVKQLVTRYRKSYGYYHDKPLIVEIFPEQKWLAARSIGLPFIPALGVCFGRVVCVDSPLVKSKPFHWRAVLAHELSHSYTLGVTEGRIPRWFTEGLAQLDERAERPLEQVRSFKLYADLRELPPMDNFDKPFLRPRSPFDISSAYFQAYLATRWLHQRYGDNGIQKMLRALAEKRVEPAKVLFALGDGDELKNKLSTFLYEYAAKLPVRAMAGNIELALYSAYKTGEQPEADELGVPKTLEPFGEKASDDSIARLAVRCALAEKPPNIAKARRLLRALVKVPNPSSQAYVLAGDVLVLMGKKRRARSYFKKALAVNPSELGAMMGLAKLDKEAGKPLVAAEHLKPITTLIYPVREAYVLLIECLKAAARPKDADVIAETLCAMRTDEFPIRLELAKTMMAIGQHKKAKPLLLEAFEVRPQSPQLLDNLIIACERTNDRKGLVEFLRARAFVDIAKKPAELTRLWQEAKGDEEQAKAIVEALEWLAPKGRRALLYEAIDMDVPSVSLAAALVLAKEGDAQGTPQLITALSAKDEKKRKRSLRALEGLAVQSFGTSKQKWRNWWQQNKGRNRRDVIFEGMAKSGYELKGQGGAQYVGLCILALDEKDWFIRHNAHLLLQEKAGGPRFRAAFWHGFHNGTGADEMKQNVTYYWKSWLKARL